MNREEARARAAEYIEGCPTAGIIPVIVDEATLEVDFGWVFFYHSEDHLRTGDPNYALAGNAPLVVTRDGKVHVTGTARPLAEYLADIGAEVREQERH